MSGGDKGAFLSRIFKASGWRRSLIGGIGVLSSAFVASAGDRYYTQRQHDYKLKDALSQIECEPLMRPGIELCGIEDVTPTPYFFPQLSFSGVKVEIEAEQAAVAAVKIQNHVRLSISKRFVGNLDEPAQVRDYYLDDEAPPHTMCNMFMYVSVSADHDIENFSDPTLERYLNSYVKEYLLAREISVFDEMMAGYDGSHIYEPDIACGEPV